MLNSKSRENLSNFIKYKLNYNKIIRIFSWPYMSFIGKHMLNEYSKTEYSARMLELKDIYLGKRCFIIGNGPSLKVSDLEMLKNEYSFSANRIYEIFKETDWRPNFYVVTDGNFIDENYDILKSYKIDRCFFEYRHIRNKDIDENTIGICRNANFAINRWNDRTIHISEDLSKYFSDGYTVTFTSIQLAIYMGFKEIYLLGVDFNYSIVMDEKGRIHKNESVKDYFNGEKYVSTFQNYASTLYAYQMAKKYADKHGIKIYNATRGGKLEVFERVDFDDLFSE